MTEFSRKLFLLFTLIPVMMFVTERSCFAARNEVIMGSGPISVFGNSTAMDLTAGYKFRLFDWLQLGADVTYFTSSFRDIKAGALTFFVGPTFNLDAPPNAYLISIGGVWRNGFSEPEYPEEDVVVEGEEPPSEDPSGLGFGFFLGKRFNISGALSYQPMIGIISTGTFSFIITPLQLSLTF